MASQMTRAQERAMLKAVKAGLVRMAGGFGGTQTIDNAIGSADFDRRRPIEHLVAKRFLKPGDYANTYVPTPLGVATLRALRAARKAKAIEEQRKRHAPQAGTEAPGRPSDASRPVRRRQAGKAAGGPREGRGSLV